MPEVTKRQKIFNKTNGRCYYCGVKLDPYNWEVDHKIPKSKGGTDSLDNSVPCCPKCNDEKGAMTVKEYFNHRRQWGKFCAH
jgi:5-methylcytosine-specific restriction endonuclease McrA